MAKMHKLVDLGPQVPREPCMWKKLHMFLEQYPAEDEFPDSKRFCLHLTPGNFDPQLKYVNVSQSNDNCFQI